MPPEPIVFLIDDDRRAVDALAFLLSIAGLASKSYLSPSAFLAEYDARIPGCLVVDMFMPEMSGLELIARLTSRGVKPVAVMLTAYPQVPLAVEAMKNGAIDYIAKNGPSEPILAAIQRALSRDAEQRRVCAERYEILARLATLTAREREVVDLIVKGHTSEEIATILGAVRRTIDSHRSHINTKMGVDGLAELIRRVLIATTPGD